MGRASEGATSEALVLPRRRAVVALVGGEVAQAEAPSKAQKHKCIAGLSLMEPTGIEPVTSCLQSRRSPS